MDFSNPAVSKYVNITPAMLETVVEDSGVLPRLAVQMLLVNMSEMHRRMADNTVPIGQRQNFMQFLADVGGVNGKTLAANAGIGVPGMILQIINQQGTDVMATTRKLAEMADVTDAELKTVTIPTPPAPDVPLDVPRDETPDV